MPRFTMGVLLSISLGIVALVVQQLVAAAITGVLAYPIGTQLRVSWLDYVEEYLIWRIREPTHGLTDTQIVANALALVTVVVGGMLVYQVIRG